MLVVVLIDSTHIGGDVVALGGGCDQHLLGSSLMHATQHAQTRKLHSLSMYFMMVMKPLS